jgi:protease-4
VVEGRKSRGLSSVERVDAVGRGAVWTGAQARGRGLVDQFGGVIAAIDRAATMAGIPRLLDEPVEVQVLPRPSKSLLGALTGMAGAPQQESPKSSSSPPLPPALRAAARLAAPYLFGPGEGFEARIPYDVEVR